MQATHTVIATLRDDPGDAVVASHRLMLRSGLARKQGSGLYSFLPLGLRVMRKIEQVIREEMEAAGAVEVLLPILTPAELWEESGRWTKMGKEMFRVKDRHEVMNALGPTHEESMTSLVKDLIRSHRDLPLNIYQMHTKFRDEIRPRFGVIRSREFVMKDSYSFDLDEAGLENTYQKMRIAYRRVFARLGLRTVPVEADSGAMGGTGSEEFMVPSEIGEETLLLSESESYRSNSEKTPVVYTDIVDEARAKPTQELSELEKLHTPNVKTIEDLAKFLEVRPAQILKTVLYMIDGQPTAVCIRGDRDVNEIKLANVTSAQEILAASPEEIKQAGSVAGFIGPLGIAKDVRILWDTSLQTGEAWIIGANEVDYHYKGCVLDPQRESADLGLARAGDPAPNGDGLLKEIKGIEVGHIFKLGYKYTDAFKLTVQNEDGKAVKPIMGTYGIGVNRTLATIIEQWHDDKGITWPVSAAPFEICLISITGKDPQQRERELTQARELYAALKDAGCDVLWDDRDLRPGVKFADSELIGYPIRLTMGKKFFQDGELEVLLRSKDEQSVLKGSSVRELVPQILRLREKLYDDLRQLLEQQIEVG